MRPCPVCDHGGTAFHVARALQHATGAILLPSACEACTASLSTAQDHQHPCFVSLHNRHILTTCCLPPVYLG
jgi:hypothetical protein